MESNVQICLSSASLLLRIFHIPNQLNLTKNAHFKLPCFLKTQNLHETEIQVSAKRLILKQEVTQKRRHFEDYIFI